MRSCYTLVVLLRTIFNTRNVVLTLERSNTFAGYGTVHVVAFTEEPTTGTYHIEIASEEKIQEHLAKP